MITCAGEKAENSPRYALAIAKPRAERFLLVRVVACVLLLCALPAAAAAFDPEDLAPEAPEVRTESEENEGIDLPEAFIGAMDRGQESLSRQVVEIGRRLDRFFGGDDYVHSPEGSSARIRLTSLYSELEGTEFDPSFKFELELPNTERRWRLIFESEDWDWTDPFNDGGPRQGPGANDDGGDSIAGVRFIRDLADYWNFETDVGIKVRTPLDPFVETKVGRSWFAGAVELRPSVEAFWYNSDGPGVETRFTVQTPLPGPRFLRVDNRATWYKDEEIVEYRHDAGITHEFSRLHAVLLHFGVRGESKPNDRVTGYSVDVRWRKNIFQDWLFLELRPELLFARDHDFKQDKRFMITLESYFGDLEW